MSEGQPLLLDTHVWLWLAFHDLRLKDALVEKIIMALSRRLLLLSAISVWEVGMLVGKGRIKLSLPLGDWLDRSLALNGLQVVALSKEIALDSCLLPGNPPNDPADKFIISTARLLRATLLTHDDRILTYAVQGHVPTFPA